MFSASYIIAKLSIILVAYLANVVGMPGIRLQLLFRQRYAIALVMLIRKVDFITGTRYLKALLENNQIKCDSQKTNTKRAENHPTHIGNILRSIVPVHMAEPPGSSKSVQACIEALEQKVELLTSQIKTITESFE